MSSKNKFFSILTIAIGIVVFSTFTMAQDNKATTTTPDKVEKPNKGEGRGMGPRKFGRPGMAGRQGQRGGPGRMIRMMLHGLDLTDAQKMQIQSILAANKPSQESMQEVRTLMMAKRQGVLTTAQQERLAAIRTQAQGKGRSVHEQILGVLTPEQKAKIDQRKQQMQDRMQQRKQMRQQKPVTAEKPKVN